MRTIGIYKIENLINHKIYVGQSVDCESRFRQHKFAAIHKGSPDHDCAIHLAMAKHGLDNFSYTIIEKCDKCILDEREVYWIRFYNSFNRGYNETEGGCQSHIHLGRVIKVYDLDGKYVTTYPNMTEAAKAIGISRNSIYGVVYGQRLSAGGYQYVRVGDNKTVSKYSNRQGGKIKIKQIDKETNKCIGIWDSAYDVSRELGIDSSAISKCVKGKLKSIGGFRWERF